MTRTAVIAPWPTAAATKAVGDDGLDGLPTRQALLVPLGIITGQSITAAYTLNPTANTATASATIAVVIVEGVNARWRDDGVAPTTTAGMLLLTNTYYTFYDTPLGSVQFIGTAAGSTINIAYYRTREF